MKPGTLLISLIDYTQTSQMGAIFTPFIPKRDTICTLAQIENGALVMEEVRVEDDLGRGWGFKPKDWRELDPSEIPSIEEVTAWVGDCELVKI